LDLYLYLDETGSGENHTAYFYERILEEDEVERLIQEHKKSCDADKQIKMTLPGRLNIPAIGFEDDEEIYCDPAFHHAVQLAAGPLSALIEYTQEVNSAFMNQERSKRERKPKAV
jgi:hypothetical protein